MSFINVSVIKRIKQDEFKTYADFVYDSMNGKPVYALFQVAVTAMSETAEKFQQALIKSKGKASEAIDAKNAAQDALINALVRIAKLMDAEWQNNAQDKLKMDAGFTLCKTPERQIVTYVNPPTNLLAYNDPRRGVIIVEYTKAENAVTTAFEVQKEDGAWENGLYCASEKMELTFPFGIKLLIRAKTIGPKLLVSDFTLPVDVMVS
jgi:hypothetical protein